MLSRVRRDQEGSTLLIALMVMMILSTLSLGVLARTLSVMSFVRNGQDFDAALAEADAGLAHAVRVLDSYAGSPPATLPNTQKPTTDPGAGEWEYVATKVNDLEYEVRVLGEVGESRQGVRAKVTRGAKYPFALFADDSLDLGPSGLDLGLSSWLTLGSPDTNAVHVGTNGELLVESGADAGDFQHIFPPDGRCSGCNPATLVTHDQEEGAYALPPVVKPTGIPTQSCPLFGTFTGVVNGMNGRPFVCERDVVMAGAVSVINPPMVVYVLPSASTGADSSLDLRTAVINAGQRADNVEIKKAGFAPLLLDLAFTPAQLTFSGVLYAPESELELQGSKWWSGSVVVDRVTVDKNALGVKPVLNIGYDLNLATASKTADWRVSRYSQTAASETGLM